MKFHQDIDARLRFLIGDHGTPLTKTRPINRTMRRLLSADTSLNREDFRSFIVIDVDGWRRELVEVELGRIDRRVAGDPYQRWMKLEFDSLWIDQLCMVWGLVLHYIPHDYWIVNPWLGHPEFRMTPNQTLVINYSLDNCYNYPDSVYQPWEDVEDCLSF
jgi:hypothetical protein